MVDSTDDPAGREGGEPGHQQTVATDPEARAETAWRKYIRHIAEECRTTCRTTGINCSKALELKAAWNSAKQAA